MGAVVRYDLIHKYIRVVAIDIDDDDERMSGVSDVYNAVLILIGIILDGMVCAGKFKSWWFGRSISSICTRLETLLEILDIDKAALLITKSLGLSFTDH